MSAPKKLSAKSSPESEPVAESTAPQNVWFESTNQEPVMFFVAGIRPIRNFTNGRLEWKVREDDITRFSGNHFVLMGRVRRKV